MQTRLMRSNGEKVLGGVCGGLAQYFNIDPVLVRLGFILLTVTTGMGLLLYGALWLALPTPEGASVLDQTMSGVRARGTTFGQQFSETLNSAVNPQPQQPRFDPNTGLPLARPTNGRNQTLGMVLLAVGGLMLASILDLTAPIAALMILGAGWYFLKKG